MGNKNTERRKERRKRAKMNTYAYTTTSILDAVRQYVPIPTPVNSLGNMTTTSMPMVYGFSTVEPKKEKKMFTDYNTVEATQRNYFLDDINSLYDGHKHKLRVQFHIDADPTPTTAEDLITRIKNDKFTMPDPKQGGIYLRWEMAQNQIIWRDPKDILDQPGYEAALVALEAAYTAAQDAAIAKPIEEALKYKELFDSWTYTPTVH